MISVYYNQKYGFLIVPNAIERFKIGRAHV